MRGIYFLLFMLVNTLLYAEPSKKDTTEFIISKTNITSESHWCKDARRQSISFNNNFCTMVVDDYILNRYYGETDQGKISCNDDSIALHDTYTVNLKDVDPTRIEKENMTWVVLYTKENKKLVKNKSDEIASKSSSDKDSLNYQEYLYIKTYDAELNLDKLYRAMQYLIIKCGGKGELF